MAPPPDSMPPAAPPPSPGLAAATLFFIGGGLLDFGFSVYEAPRPLAFWTVWGALGSALMHFLLAAALWRRLALARSFAMVYCLAIVLTYAGTLVLAYNGAPRPFPLSIIVQSLYEVPSCLLLFPYLRSPETGALLDRPLWR